MGNKTNKLTRNEFFKDKGLLFLLLSLEIIVFYLYIIFYQETKVFLVPLFITGILGLFGLWFISENRKLKGV